MPRNASKGLRTAMVGTSHPFQVWPVKFQASKGSAEGNHASQKSYEKPSSYVKSRNHLWSQSGDFPVPMLIYWKYLGPLGYLSTEINRDDQHMFFCSQPFVTQEQLKLAFCMWHKTHIFSLQCPLVISIAFPSGLAGTTAWFVFPSAQPIEVPSCLVKANNGQLNVWWWLRELDTHQ